MWVMLAFYMVPRTHGALRTFSMESLQWTLLLLVIFATSISVEAGIRPFEEAFLTYGKKLSCRMVFVYVNIESSIYNLSHHINQKCL